METVRNMDRAPLGHPRLSSAPEIETVATVIPKKSDRHSEDLQKVRFCCEVQHLSVLLHHY